MDQENRLTMVASSLKNQVKLSRLQRNNFDLLRFAFAFIVFLVHSHALSGADSLAVLSAYFSSEIAVRSFFVVSGFLIFMSYENSRDAQSYFAKRVRRIYPAYFFIIIFCALMGGVFSTYSWEQYLSLQTLKYVAANLVFLNFLQPTLPGLFEENTLQAVNGALWTLKVEVMFYMFVPLAVLAFHKFGRLPVLVVIYAFSVLYSLVMQYYAAKTGSTLYLELQRQLPGQLTFFIAGAAAYYYFDYLVKYSTWLAVFAVMAFVLQSWLPWLVIQPVALAILVVYVACVIPSLGNFGKYGDFSYGIYIVHFPILQVLISYGIYKNSPWMMLLVAGVIMMVSSFLLWHFLEKRFLRKSSHYVAEQKG